MLSPNVASSDYVSNTHQFNYDTPPATTRGSKIAYGGLMASLVALTGFSVYMALTENQRSAAPTDERDGARSIGQVDLRSSPTAAEQGSLGSGLLGRR